MKLITKNGKPVVLTNKLLYSTGNKVAVNENTKLLTKDSIIVTVDNKILMHKTENK